MTRLKLATRNSPLALIQADMVKRALQNKHPQIDVEIVPVKSQADWVQSDGEKPLSEEAGGKGMFASEIEKMILAGEVDAGVHSLKDMATDLPQGLHINYVLPRADMRDAFISNKVNNLEDLPEGATIGTCSPRRAAFALNKRSDLKILPFRGNVETRLQKVREGQVDATFLAMAGLERLKIKDDMINPLSVDQFLPACGQGIVCIESREGDQHINALLKDISCHKTFLCSVAERTVLKVLDGSCQTPIAAYACFEKGQLHLRGQVLSEDGQAEQTETIQAICNSDIEAEKLGQHLGQKLKEFWS